MAQEEKSLQSFEKNTHKKKDVVVLIDSGLNLILNRKVQDIEWQKHATTALFKVERQLLEFHCSSGPVNSDPSP